jgi:hypothetical protein
VGVHQVDEDALGGGLLASIQREVAHSGPQ